MKKNNNGIINLKELKRHWETNTILSLIIVSAYCVGIYTGSVHWDEIYSGYYVTEHTLPEPVIANTDVDTLDTELMGNPTSGFNFTGRVIATNAPVNQFECSINGLEWGPCDGGGVEIGGNIVTFEVRAVNGSQVDHTPAAWMEDGL